MSGQRISSGCDTDQSPPGSAGLSRVRPGDGQKAGAQAGERPPRLLITGHFVFTGRVGGAEQMLYNLVRGFSATGTEVGLLYASEQNLDPTVFEELRSLPGVSLTGCGGGIGPRFVGEQLACLRGDLGADATLFPNYFVPPLVPRRLGRVVAVFHDMQYRHLPQYFSAKKRAWLTVSQALAMHRADRVIAISEFVRQDILRCYGQRFARKVVVVTIPISWDRFASPAGLPPPIAQPYVLSVTAHYAHKNLDTLVRAFAQVARRDRDLQLVLCGQDYNSLRGVPGKRPGLAPLIEELGLRDRVHVTGHVDNAALGRWYRHAAMFAFPSIFEGFGAPPAEALGFGLPTLTTRRTALPEATLGLAETVGDPFSVDEWADRIRSIASDPGRHRPSAADVARVRAHYDPDRIARQYAEVCWT